MNSGNGFLIVSRTIKLRHAHASQTHTRNFQSERTQGDLLHSLSVTAWRAHSMERGCPVKLGWMWNQRAGIASVIFTAILAVAGGFLCFYAFSYSPSQHALMNVEGIIALSFLALLCTRSKPDRRPLGPVAGPDVLHIVLAVAIMGTVIAAAFAPILHTPFLYDDYTHITDASRSTWHSIMRDFGPVTGRGLFFRPAGFLFYWLNYLWAVANPVLWHASSIALHIVCSCLTYLLCREIGLSRPASLTGAFFFAVSGISAETVAWIDARFDLMTTSLALLCLIFVCRYATTGNSGWLIGSLAVGICGMLSKESGYCLPLLIASLGLCRDRKDWNRIWRAAGLAGVLGAVLFAYRWWALGGIGGYPGEAGEPAVLHFNALRTLDALLLREWAVLFFPFNWYAPANWTLRAALVASPLVLAWIAWMAKAPRRPLIGCIVFVIAAALPVQHLLLLSPGLSGSRALYLGSVGWALLWALVLDSMARRQSMVIACLLLALQGFILEHNLIVWRDTAELARSVCVAFGRSVASTSGPIIVRNLPAARMGAAFLSNGFPQCVEMNSGVPAWRIRDAGVAESGAHQFVWNEAAGRIEEATRN